MKIRHAITAAFIALASVGAVTAASAQGLTRAEVQQQLIQAEENGSRFVSDTSYPDVSPVFAQQFAHQSAGKRLSCASSVGYPMKRPQRRWASAPPSCTSI